MLDLFGDRATAFKMYDKNVLQEYLRNPTFEGLMKVWGFEFFYSGRNLRAFDNMKKAIRAHHKIEQKAKAWFRERAKGTAAETLESIEIAVQGGKMDRADMEQAKRDLLGIWTLPEIPKFLKNRIPEKWQTGYDELRKKLRIPGIGPVRYTRLYADYLGAVAMLSQDIAPQSLLQAFLEFIGQIFKQSAQQFGNTR